jgi:putative nucleotidyltransferase with HDIG domain
LVQYSKEKNQQHPRPLYHTLILLGVGCLFILFVVLVQPFYSVNLWLSDQLFVSELPSPNIVIAGIDDDALETYGRWSSWSRNLHSQAINNLSKAGAKVIGFDILFADSTSDDEMLAATMKSAGNVILPIVGTEPHHSADPMVTYTGILSPVPSLEQETINLGHGNILPDPDGTVRRLPLVIRDNIGQSYPAFSLAVLHTLFSVPLPQEYSRQDGALHLLDRKIPVDTSYYYRINFTPEEAQRPYISYKDVISGDFSPLVVADKVVLIGMVATGELDKWAVPTSVGKVPGVYIQAAIMDNILQKQFLTEVGTDMTVMILLLMTAIIGFTLPRFGLRWGGIIVGSLFAGYLVASFLAFERGYILSILYPLMLPPVIFVSSSLTKNVALAFENTKLNIKVVEGYKSTIRALAASIDAKDPYTHGHSQRVTEYALLIAKELQIPREDLEVLEYAGILHDIGKIGMPDNILRKLDHLNTEELDMVRMHPDIGAKIVEGIPFLEESRKLILHHHEKYDGTGYPEGLAGTDIPFGARLLAVVDSFDSMTSDRAYRKALKADDVLNELHKYCGTQFCPVAVEAFFRCYQKGLMQCDRS